MSDKTENARLDLYINTAGTDATVRNLTSDMRKLKNEIANLSPATEEFRLKSAKLSEVKNKLNEITGAAKQTNAQVKEVAGSFLSWKDLLLGGGIAGAITVLFTSIKAKIFDAVKSNREYAKSLSELSSLLGVTGKDLKFFDKTAKELGVNVEGGAKKVLEAMKLIGSAKPELLKSKEGLQEVTEAAILLSHAAGLELPEASTRLTDALNQFNLPASESGRVVNLLAAAAKEGAAEIPELTEAMLKAGTTARSANVSIEETAAILEAYAEKGIKGAEAGTALRNVLTKLSAPDTLPKEAIGVFQQYGVNLDILKDKTIPLSKRLEELSKIGTGASNIVKVFGLENKNAGQLIIETRGRIEELTQAVTGTDEAYKQAKINLDNQEGDLIKFGAAYESVALKFGGSSDGIIRNIIQVGTAILTHIDPIGEAFDAAFQPIKDLYKILGDLVAQLSPFESGLSGIEVGVKLVATAFNTATIPFRILLSFLTTIGEACNYVINEGKKLANFFGSDFQIDPDASFANLKDRFIKNGTDIVDSYKKIWTDVKKETESNISSDEEIQNFFGSGTDKPGEDTDYGTTESKADKAAKKKADREADALIKKWERLREIAQKGALDQLNDNVEFDQELEDQQNKSLEDFINARVAAMGELKNHKASDQENEIAAVEDHYLKMRNLALENGIDTAGLEEIRNSQIALINQKYREKDLADTLAINKKKQLASAQNYQALGSMLSNFGDLVTATNNLIGSQGAQMSGFQKTLTLVSIAIDTAAAIASNIAGATAAAATVPGPQYPIVLAGYVASGLATILTAAANARKVLAPASSLSAPSFTNSIGGGGRTNFKEFATGGYTGIGRGPVDRTGERPVGIVHEEEYVVSKKMREIPWIANTVGIMETIRLRGFANGGYTSAPPNTSNEANREAQIMNAEYLDVLRDIKTHLANPPSAIARLDYTQYENDLETVEAIRTDANA